MEAMDITLALSMSALLMLHLLFCIKASKPHIHINPFQRKMWMLVSLLLGPLGYYLFQMRFPLDILDD